MEKVQKRAQVKKGNFTRQKRMRIFWKTRKARTLCLRTQQSYVRTEFSSFSPYQIWVDFGRFLGPNYALFWPFWVFFELFLGLFFSLKLVVFWCFYRFLWIFIIFLNFREFITFFAISRLLWEISITGFELNYHFS